MSGWRWSDWERHHQRTRSRTIPIERRSCLYEGRERTNWQGWLWLAVLCFVWLLIGLSIGLWIAS